MLSQFGSKHIKKAGHMICRITGKEIITGQIDTLDESPIIYNIYNYTVLIT